MKTTINEVHVKRLGALIKYIKKNATDGKLSLKRSEIAEICGVCEGDSLKKIFKLLNEYPEYYSNDITYLKEGKLNIFTLKEENPIFSQMQNDGVILEPVISCGNGSFLTSLPISKINELWDQQILTYNPEIQRGKKKKIVKGEEIEEDVCSVSNIQEIAMKILENKYFHDTIILNASKCKLNLSDGKLTILKDSNESEFNISDGQHRTKSIRLAFEIYAETENAEKVFPNFNPDMQFPIQIETFDVKDAQSAFHQYTKGLKISTTRSEYFNNTDERVSFLKNVIAASKYNDQVELIKDSIKNTSMMVSFGTFATAFKDYFKEEDLSDNLKDYLVGYLNILNDFIKEHSIEDSMLKENIAYYGYMALARKLYVNKVELSREKIFTLLQNIEQDKSANIWLGKVVLQGKKKLSVTNKRDTRIYVGNVISSFITKLA